jgi:glycosyltransferase involved in cell wall biosynthesis
MSAKPSSQLTVSVALCTYNGGSYIEEQLLSILSQRLLPSEIVISDDGSSDDTVAKARAITDAFTASNEHSPIFHYLLNAAPMGVARNFQQAIQATSSDLVALSDQDDVWADNRLETLVHSFAAEPDLILMGSGAQAIDAEGKPLGFTLFEAIAVTQGEWEQLESGRAYDALVRRNLFTGATMIFRRDLFEIAAPFPNYWLHDEWLAIVGAAVGQVRISREQLTGYRQHGANVAGITSQTAFNKLRKITKLFENRAKRNKHLRYKAEALVKRLEELHANAPAGSAEVLEARLRTARSNLEHEDFRLGLPRLRLFRVRRIAVELASGRYDLYDYGKKDALRDLLQSP